MDRNRHRVIETTIEVQQDMMNHPFLSLVGHQIVVSIAFAAMFVSGSTTLIINIICRDQDPPRHHRMRVVIQREGPLRPRILRRCRDGGPPHRGLG